MVGIRKATSDRISGANGAERFYMLALFMTIVAIVLAGLSLFIFYSGASASGGFLSYDTLKWSFPLMLVMMAVAAVLWMQHVKTQTGKAKNISAEAEFRAKRDQDAILRLMDELAEFSNGDLTVEAQVTEDFTGAIADSVNYAIESMRELVGTINHTASQVSDASVNSRHIAEQMLSSSNEQADRIHNITQIIDDMVSSLERVATSTNDSAEIARNSVAIAREGASRVRDTIGGMNNIRENIQETSKRIKRLGESSQEIGNIVEIIKGIADQTNILALNAAIQATSAGEAGRGFAVVASEVRKLAEESAKSTQNIEQLINKALLTIDSGMTVVTTAADSLTGITEHRAVVDTVIRKLNEQSRQQQCQMEAVNQLSQTILNVVTDNSAVSEECAASSSELSAYSDSLKESINKFKTK